MTAIPFAQLATYISKQDIPAVQGTISKLYDNPKTGVSEHGPWCMHNGKISDGNLEHDIVFAMEGPSDNLKGKTILIECGRTGQGKLCDLSMDEYNGKRKIKVGKRAKITILDGSTPSPVSSPSQPAATQPRPSPVAGNGIPVGESTVAERVDTWFRIFEVVCQEAGQNSGEVQKSFSPSDLKEITTGISMSYKGQYGVYAPPYFGAEKQTPGRWQDFLYPSKPPRKLGEVPEIDLLRYVTWALSLKEDTVKPEQLEVWENVMAMAKDKGWNTDEPVLKDDEEWPPN